MSPPFPYTNRCRESFLRHDAKVISRHRGATLSAEDKLQALDAQVASGQISIDEYLRRRAALNSGDAPETDSAPTPSAAPTPSTSPAQAQPSAAQPSAAQPFAPQPPAPQPPAPQPFAAPPLAPQPFAAQPPAAQPQPPAQPQSPLAAQPFAREPVVAPDTRAPAAPAAGLASSAPWQRAEPAPQPPSSAGPGTGTSTRRPDFATPPLASPTAQSSRRALMPLISAAVVLLIVIAGVVWLLIGRGDDGTPNGNRTTGASTSEPSPEPSGPFRIGPITGVTSQGDVTGEQTLAQAVTIGQMSEQERSTLATCGATTGSTEGFVSSGAWSARSWVFECSSSESAQTATTALIAYYRNNGFTTVSAPPAPAGATAVLRDQPGDARLHAEYVSDATVVMVEVSGTTVADAQTGLSTIYKAVSPRLPSTFAVA